MKTRTLLAAIDQIDRGLMSLDVIKNLCGASLGDLHVVRGDDFAMLLGLIKDTIEDGKSVVHEIHEEWHAEQERLEERRKDERAAKFLLEAMENIALKVEQAKTRGSGETNADHAHAEAA